MIFNIIIIQINVGNYKIKSFNCYYCKRYHDRKTKQKNKNKMHKTMIQ